MDHEVEVKSDEQHYQDDEDSSSRVDCTTSGDDGMEEPIGDGVTMSTETKSRAGVDNNYNEADNNDEDEMRHRHRDKGKKMEVTKKQKRLRVMTASRQTDAERRVLRRKQRELQNDISLDAPAATTNAAAYAASRCRDDDHDSSDDDDYNDDREKIMIMEDCNDNANKSKLLLSWRNDNNALWNDVRYPREAVLDSENMGLITAKAAREAEKIVHVPRYDAIALAINLVKKGSIRTRGISQFNWKSLGFQVGVCFSSLPSNCSFLYGPLDSDYKPKKRKKVERKDKSDEGNEEVEEEKPEIQDQRGKRVGNGNELSAVEEHIKIINKTLQRRTSQELANAEECVGQYMTQLTQEEGIQDERELEEKKRKFVRESSKVDAVNCLFNPKSFTQTVENVFHFSFAVNKGAAEIKVRGAEEAEEFGLEPGPVARARDPKKDTGVPKQAIVSLSMKDWRDMCAAFSVEESDVPHR